MLGSIAPTYDSHVFAEQGQDLRITILNHSMAIFAMLWLNIAVSTDQLKAA